MDDPQLVTFADRYFRLPFLSRLVVRVLAAGTLAFVLASGIVLVQNPVLRLRAAGLFLLMFSFNTILHVLEGKRAITTDALRRMRRGMRPRANDYLPLRSFSFLDQANADAELSGVGHVCLFVLRRLMREREIVRGMARLGIDAAEFRHDVEAKIGASKKTPVDGVKGLSVRDQRLEELDAIARLAFTQAVALGEKTISTSALFAASLAANSNDLFDVFSKFHLAQEDFLNAIVFGRLSKGLGRSMRLRRGTAQGNIQAGSRVNRAWTSRPTVYLDSVSEDLTDKARRSVIGFLVGHEQEYQSMVNILARPTRNNVILVGDEDIGKGAMVEHLAFEMVRDNVPEKLFDKRLVQLDLTRLSAGAETTGEVLERFGRVTEEILAAGNIVLYIPDIHTIEQLSNKGELSAFESLEKLAQTEQIPIVGATTPRLYRQIIELNQKFVTLFDVVKIGELNQDETVRLLIYESYAFENEWKVIISYPAIRKTVELAYQFMHQKPLPRASLDLLQEALVEAHNLGSGTLTPEIVTALVSRKTSIPIAVAKGKEAEQLLHLEDLIHKNLIDQEEAVKAVAAALRQYRAGLARQKGPIAAFLFVGPTGVGKTELSKVLTSLYFGSENAMIRFDMSEYQDQKAIAQFIGSADGANPGILTESVRQKPFSLILLDEFEKANSQLIDIFLPVFDEGKITDTLGNVIDFKNSIIICTSNANSQYIKEQIEQGKSVADFADELKHRLIEYFKPELLNRFDGIIAFRQLSRQEIEQIVVLNLQKLADQIASTHGIAVQFADGVSAYVAELGYDPVFGARPMRSVISAKIKDPLAREILEGKALRNDTIRVVMREGDIAFEKE